MTFVRTLYYLAAAATPLFFIWVLIYISRLDQTTAAWVAGAAVLYPLALSTLLLVLGVPLLIHARVKLLPLWPVSAAMAAAASPWLYFVYRALLLATQDAP